MRGDATDNNERYAKVAKIRFIDFNSWKNQINRAVHSDFRYGSNDVIQEHNLVIL